MPATVSYKVHWKGAEDEQEIGDGKNFRLEVTETTATIQWSASNGNGYTFHSDPAHTSVNEFAEIGHEENGVFLHGD